VRPLLAWPLPELEAWCADHGGRPFHARVARREVLNRGVVDTAEMTGLPRSLREAMAAEAPPLAGREVDRRLARDGTTKLLIEFPGDPTVTVETVHIPARRDSGKGATLCVSTQAGCPVGCPFCASGLAGLARNLEAHEVLEQFVRGAALGPLGRSVVMGIGEPLLNYAALTEALEVVSEELGLGARKVTVSTIGFPDRLRRAARANPRYQLAISLHSPDQAQRDELVPAMAGVPIEEVLAGGDDWFEVTGREVTYEYVLLGGVNDSAGHAARLAEHLRGRRGTVNLIPYNPTPELPYARPAPEAVQAFAEHLRAAGLVATVRWSRGLEEFAACGQLRLTRGE